MHRLARHGMRSVEVAMDGTLLIAGQALARPGAAPLLWPAGADASTGWTQIAWPPMGLIRVEALLEAGRCQVLRVLLQPAGWRGRWQRYWRAWFGQSAASAAREAWQWQVFAREMAQKTNASAVDIAQSVRVHLPWGELMGGAVAVRGGAACLTLALAGAVTEDAETLASAPFWRRLTRTELRQQVVLAQHRAARLSWGATGLRVGETLCLGPALPPAALLTGFNCRQAAGRVRAVGTVGGWHITVAFHGSVEAGHAEWALLRLAVPQTGPDDLRLEHLLHAAHRRLLRGVADAAPGWRCRAVLDSTAGTGAEVLLEWVAPP